MATQREVVTTALVPFRAALVVVDMQQGFINSHTDHLPVRIARLIDARRFGHVLFTQFFNGRGSPHRKILQWHRMMGEPETRLVEPLATRARRVVPKDRYTCFSPEMVRWLASHDEVTTLVFCGIATECCVLKSALDAFEQGFVPFVLEDCCASHGGPDAHAAGLTVLRRTIGAGQVVSSETMLARLEAGPTLTLPG